MRRLMRGAAPAIGILVAIFGARTVFAAPVRVAIATFDYDDSAGEVRNETAAHAALLAGLTADITHALSASGEFAPAALQCGRTMCSANALDATELTRAAKAADARYLVFGGVHKVSTLIQYGQIEVMDVTTGKARLSRTVSFRGDDADAWRHAGTYIGRMVVDALK